MGRSKFVFDLLMKTWPLGKVVNRLGSRPLLEPLLRSQFSAEENEAVIIPVEETIQGTHQRTVQGVWTLGRHVPIRSHYAPRRRKRRTWTFVGPDRAAHQHPAWPA